MFDTFPTYDRYRTLEMKTPALRGEDVYALQTALNELSFGAGTPDGIYGPMTDRAVREAQQTLKLVVDGKAGGATQKALALTIASQVSTVNRGRPPYSALLGQLEHESGFRLGIYSPLRPDNTYDAGVTQRNTKFTSPQIGFDTKKSILALAEVVRDHHDLFTGVLSERRRWALAQGAWNAPAFACYIAREEGATKVTTGMTLRPSLIARTTFEDYVTKVSKYLEV